MAVLENIRKKAIVDESGSTIPFYVSFFIVLTVFIVLTSDLAGALLLHEARTNDLASIRDSLESDAQAMLIKNSDDPGMYVAKEINSRLRKCGFTGETTVYFYELSKSEMPNKKTTVMNMQDSRRLMAWVVVTKEQYLMPVGSGFNINPIHVQATISATSMPYSGGETWRPQASTRPTGSSVHPSYNGKYVFPESSVVNQTPNFSASTATYTDGSVWPQTLTYAVNVKKEQMNQENF